MEKAYRILAINPGSTSTKIAIFTNEEMTFSRELKHSAEDLKDFHHINDQLDFRLQAVLTELKKDGIALRELDAVVARGGNMKPVVGGTYQVNEEMLRDLEIGVMGQHASNLGGRIAYAIAQMNSRSNTIMILLITMPTWVNMLVRTYAWMGILQDEGILNTILGFFGIGPVSMIHTSFAVILGMVYNFIPFMILQIHTSLAKMDKSLLEAANDLGATPVQAFLRVTLPLSLPGVISGITLVFLPAVSSFFIPKLLGGGQFVLVGNIIESQFLTSGDWNFGSAISLIMAIIIMLSMWLTRKVDVQPASRGKE